MQSQEHICLIGFMASGKSTIAKALSRQLGIASIDLDASIEETAQMSISQYFESNGEKAFRKLELETLRKLLKLKDPVVISLGGGTPCQDSAIRLLSPVTTIYLRVAEEELIRRLVDSDRSIRPLISHLEEHEIKSLVKSKMSVRRAYYSQADITINNNTSVDQVVARILRSLKRKRSDS